MPTFSYSSSGFPFTPFTKILSADVNSCFNDLKTFLNVTKLDSTNVQSHGLTRDRLGLTTPGAVIINSGTGEMSEITPVGNNGLFLASNGTAFIATTNPLSTQFNVIMGSAAQVTAGQATHSSFAAVTQADGDRVLILPGYTESASWTITKKLYIKGLGNTSQITGSVTFATGSSNSVIECCRITTGVTVDSGVTGVVCVQDIFFPASVSFTDNSTALNNYLAAMQES